MGIRQGAGGEQLPVIHYRVSNYLIVENKLSPIRK